MGSISMFVYGVIHFLVGTKHHPYVLIRIFSTFQNNIHVLTRTFTAFPDSHSLFSCMHSDISGEHTQSSGEKWFLSMCLFEGITKKEKDSFLLKKKSPFE